MEDHAREDLCGTCRIKIGGGTYVACSGCDMKRICTRCYVNDTVHHDHRGPVFQPVIAPVKQKKIGAMTRMMANENGRCTGEYTINGKGAREG